MELNALNILLFNLIAQVLGSILFYIFVRIVLLRKIVFFKLFFLYMLLFIPYALIGRWVYMSGLIHLYPLQVNWGIEFLSYINMILLLRVLIKSNWRKSTILAISFQFITSSSVYLTSIVKTSSYDLTNLYDFLRYTFDTFLFAPLLSGFIFWLMGRIHFSYLLNTLLKSEKKQTLFSLISFCLPFLYTWISLATNEKDYFARGVYSLFLLLTFLGFIRYMVMNESNLAKLQAKEALLIQQQSYTEHLEKMQEDMRLFRHDYKNMLSSMYLYAKEGDSKPIQDFIQKSLDAMDESMSEELRHTAHLSKIQIIELKSLVLTKLMQMRKKQIPCCLEVSDPLVCLSVNMDELCRCIGILLDNAMEAAKTQESSFVNILIKNEPLQTTFIIQNPTTDIKEFHRIWEYGYSTKGVNRGLGLYNYHRILSHYENVFTSTYINNHCFVQELTIKEG